MIEIECEPATYYDCDCCGGVTTPLTRFLYLDDEAHAIYYAGFTDAHTDREVQLLISLGEWGDDSGPDDRTAFALVLHPARPTATVTVVDGEQSPWQGADVVGDVLAVDEALAHPWLEEVQRLAAHIAMEDPEINEFLG